MDNTQIWSWVVTIIGIVGFYFAGKKVWWCWYINIANQFLWMTFGMATEQYGFVLGAIFYTAVFGKNAAAWTKEHRDNLLMESYGKAISAGMISDNEARLSAEARVASSITKPDSFIKLQDNMTEAMVGVVKATSEIRNRFICHYDVGDGQICGQHLISEIHRFNYPKSGEKSESLPGCHKFVKGPEDMGIRNLDALTSEGCSYIYQDGERCGFSRNTLIHDPDHKYDEPPERYYHEYKE